MYFPIRPFCMLGHILNVHVLGHPWLLIFDNADDIETLRVAWPGNSQGSVLVTTRDFNAVYNLTLAGYHVLPFDDAAGSDVLLKLAGLNAQLPSNKKNSQAISQALGGLPLALAQIGGFISKRKIPLHEFLPLYERHSTAIDSKKIGVGDYDHTLSTVWEMSLTKLSGGASKLLNLLTFFEPDTIHELVLMEGSKLLDNKEFEFLQDEMRYTSSLGIRHSLTNLLASAMRKKFFCNPPYLIRVVRMRSFRSTASSKLL
jgi:hypothetical protein